jgi:hypothetical protein
MQAAPHVRINPAAVSMHVLAQLALQRVTIGLLPLAVNSFNACSGATRIATLAHARLKRAWLKGFNACSGATRIATGFWQI